MVSRIRSRSFAFTGGTATWHGTGTLAPIASSISYNESCSDTIGNWDLNNPFSHTRTANKGWSASGSTKDPKFDHYSYAGFFAGSVPAPIVGGPTPPSDLVSLEMAKARTNINRPITDLPVFIAEIRDIPRIVHTAGNLILHGKRLLRREKTALYRTPFRAAEGYLGYEFGIKPLVRDVWNMLNFVSTVNDKIAKIDKLYSHGGEGSGYHATVFHDIQYGAASYAYLTPLYGETNYFKFTPMTERKKWVSLKWKPLSAPPKTANDKFWLAARLAYGTDISFATLWEAMPWSWLVDWFTNVGDALMNTRNTVPCNAGNSCIMFQTRTKWFDATRVSGTGATPSLLDPPRLDQSRVVGGGTGGVGLTRDLPFLDGRQLSILGALAVSRLGYIK